MINVWKSLLTGNIPLLMALTMAFPIFLLFNFILTGVTDTIDRDNLPEELREQFDTTTAMFSAIPVLFIVVMVFAMGLRSNAHTIIKTRNIEKRMEKLKKLGASKFVKQTKAKIINLSPRGNALYSSDEIIKGRKVKFLIYKDKSTNRKYISFVGDEWNDADGAMASKFSLSGFEYNQLKVDNEA